MKFSFEAETACSPEQLWQYYADVTRWFKWEDDLQEISLDGDFEEGSCGQMTLAGMPPMAFTLTKVVPLAIFVDKTEIPGMGDVYFHHELQRLETGTLVKHTVEFIPTDQTDSKEASDFAAQIFADVPASIFSLIEAANG